MKEINVSGKINLKRFYIRRYLRLTPLYFFILAIAAVIWINQSTLDMSYLWYNVFYLNNYVHLAHEKMPWAWSLAVEEQYYLIFPIFLLLAWRFGKNKVFYSIILLAAISLALSELGWGKKKLHT